MSEKHLEQILWKNRKNLPAVLDAWLGDARAELEKLTRAAADESISDDEFMKTLRDFAADPLRIVKLMNPDALRDSMENAMGAAMATGKVEIREKAENKL